MAVNEGLEIVKAEEAVAELQPNAAVETAPQDLLKSRSWLRLLYSLEYLIALITVFTVWSQVGGQGHLDLMPWYTKLLCGVAMAWCFVRLTAGLVEEEKAWNSRTVRWFAGLLAIGILMGGVTLYYHLHESSDEPDSDDTTATSVRVVAPSSPLSLTSDRANR